MKRITKYKNYFLILFGYFFSFKTIRNVHVRCQYMAYACGDCTPQYRIIEVYNPLEWKDELIGKEMNIRFEGKPEEEMYDEKVYDCMICYWYEFQGDLVISGSEYNLAVKEYKFGPR